ncbi:hypothetical protein JXK06_02945 [Patescibacteria group bacterium]|nr:hypothetical protein [Patescibacteria group bacterium]
MQKTKKTKINNYRAFALIDVILGAALFLLVTTFVVPAYLYGQESAQIDGKRLRALNYAETGLEAVRAIRDNNFNNLNPGTFGLTINNNFWEFNGSSDSDGEFTRKIDLIPSGDNRLIARSTVTWAQNSQRNGEIILETLITNFKKEEPLVSDFDYSINIYDDWIAGYCAEVTVLTDSPDPIDWELEVDLSQAPEQAIPYTVWNANWSFNETILSASNLPDSEWNKTSLDTPAVFNYCANRPSLPISIVGVYSSPSDNNSQAGPISSVVIPQEDLVIGDFIVLLAAYQGNSTININESGGQNWEAFNNINLGNHISSRIFFTIYNGTLNANPSVTVGSGNSAMSLLAYVFRNTDPYWAIDTWENSGTYNSPKNPGDVTINSISTNSEDAMVLAFWNSRDNSSWALQSPDWSNLGLSQYRNLQGNGLSLSAAYKVIPSPGASGDVINRQTINRQRGTWHIFAIKKRP